MTPSDYATLTRHLDGMVRAPRPPRLDRVRVWPTLAQVRAAVPRLP